LVAAELYGIGWIYLFGYYISLTFNFEYFTIFHFPVVEAAKANTLAPPPLPGEQGNRMQCQSQGLLPLPTAGVGPAISNVSGQGGDINTCLQSLMAHLTTHIHTSTQVTPQRQIYESATVRGIPTAIVLGITVPMGNMNNSSYGTHFATLHNTTED
jgi:hypothetical protein